MIEKVAGVPGAMQVNDSDDITATIEDQLDPHAKREADFIDRSAMPDDGDAKFKAMDRQIRITAKDLNPSATQRAVLGATISRRTAENYQRPQR